MSPRTRRRGGGGGAAKAKSASKRCTEEALTDRRSLGARVFALERGSLASAKETIAAARRDGEGLHDFIGRTPRSS